MNVYRVIILTALTSKFVIDLLSDWLNLKSLNPELPLEFRDFYDAEKYRLSQNYTKERTRFHFVESTFGLTVLLAFWFAAGFNHLDSWVRVWNLNTVLTGLLYIGILALASHLLSLPFSVYSTFVIEERFGFNKTTGKTFVMDQLKGLMLVLLLGAPLLAAILWFFQVMGNNAWLYCWLISIAFLLVVQFIAPIWIMPLFNKFTPLQDGDLKNAILDYTRLVSFSFKDIFVVDASKRSTKPNAFFTGFGKNKRIALFDTLVAEQTLPEVMAVLAHEIGHYKKKHVILMLAATFLELGILFFLLSFFITNPGLFDAFYMERVSAYAGLLFFGMLYEPISLVLSVLMHIFSRSHELQADRYAVETTENPEYLVSSLKKLSVKTLSNLTPHPLYVFLHYSHPPLQERITKIRASAQA